MQAGLHRRCWSSARGSFRDWAVVRGLISQAQTFPSVQSGWHSVNSLRPTWISHSRKLASVLADARGQAMAAETAPPAADIVLDKAAFDEVIVVPALRVPKRKCHEFMKRLSG